MSDSALEDGRIAQTSAGLAELTQLDNGLEQLQSIIRDAS
jgi:hypothetical protein